MQKLAYNTAIQPLDEKYRTIRLSNLKIRQTIVEVPGAVDVLKSFGWQEGVSEAGEAVLTLPKGTNMTMQQVVGEGVGGPAMLVGRQAAWRCPCRVSSRLSVWPLRPGMLLSHCRAHSLLFLPQVRSIQDAQQAFKKSAAQIQRSKSATSLPGTEAQERLRAQIEADRAERAARDPVTKASVAQPLPGSSARIATARDAGMNTGCDC